VPIEWLDHQADAAFRAEDSTLSGVFSLAAQAVFSLMLDLPRVQPRRRHPVDLLSATLDTLLVEWLSDLLAQTELTGLVFSRFRPLVSGDWAAGYRCRGDAWGEPIDPARHAATTQIKGVTHLGLRVEAVPGGWSAQVVVDV
jgi:SHS2 domain-containing protein